MIVIIVIEIIIVVVVVTVWWCDCLFLQLREITWKAATAFFQTIIMMTSSYAAIVVKAI